MLNAVQDPWPVTQTKSTEHTEPQTKNMRKFFCPEDGGDQVTTDHDIGAATRSSIGWVSQ